MNSEAGTLLVEGNLISEAQLQQALTTAVQHGGSLVQSLIRLGHVTGGQLASFLASRLRLPMAEHSQFDNLPAFITRLIPNDIVISHRLVPIMLHKGVLHVAMSDPTDRAALEEIGFATGYTASPVVAPDELVEEAMARYYGIPPDEKPIPVAVEAPVQPVEPAPQEDYQPPTAFSISPAPARAETEQPAEQPARPDVPDEAEEPEEPEPTSEPVEEAGPTPARKHLEVVETDAAEMEELFFGLGREDRGVVHLTRKKDTDPMLKMGTITDAVRSQTTLDEPKPTTEPSGPGSFREPPPPPQEPLMPEPPAPPPAPTREEAIDSFIKDEKSTAEYLLGLLESRKSVFASPVSRPPAPAKFPEPVVPGGPGAPAGEPVDVGEMQLPEIDVAEPEYETETIPLCDFEEVRTRLSEASDRDEVARLLIRFGLDFFPRLALFIVKKDTTVGWMGAGQEITNKLVKGINIPMGSPSVFRTVKETATDYFGSLPRTSVNDVFISTLGSFRPRQILVVPINVRNKPVSIFYGDCGSGMGFMKDLSPVYRMIQEASRTFERIILSQKVGRKGMR